MKEPDDEPYPTRIERKPITNLATLMRDLKDSLPLHLREDASFLCCSQCGRKSYGGDVINAACKMPQPDGAICKGILEGNKS